MIPVLPLFLPNGHGAQLLQLKRQHENHLAELLKPLESRFSVAEREAVGVAGIAQATAQAWEANQRVLDALLPPAVRSTLALPMPTLLIALTRKT